MILYVLLLFYQLQRVPLSSSLQYSSQIWTKNANVVNNRQQVIMTLTHNLEQVYNFRQVFPSMNLPLYRSAALDNATSEDVRYLLETTGIESIIDLRNVDEIVKGFDLRKFKGAMELYSNFDIAIDAQSSIPALTSMKNRRDWKNSLRPSSSSTDMSSQLSVLGNNVGTSSKSKPQRLLYELPLFGDVQQFWRRVKERMITSNRLSSLRAGYLSLFDTDTLSAELTKNLAEEGFPLLYTVMCEMSASRIGTALDLCLYAVEEKSPLLFHCAQGKDRTGILSMLLEFALGGDNAKTETIAIENYVASERILASTPFSSKWSAQAQTKSQSADSISSLRGAPPEALSDTLTYLRDKFGSIDGYLDYAGFDTGKRQRLRAACSMYIISESTI